jgi:tetratricopeptide (TPR) repeat protein
MITAAMALVLAASGSQDRQAQAEERVARVLWEFEAGGPVRSSPALADLDGDRVVDCVVGSDDHDESERVERMLDAADRQDPAAPYREAIARYTRALELNPNDADAHYNRGDAYWALGRWQSSRGEDPTESYRAAIEDFTRALERSPSDAKVHFRRGNAYSALGECQSLRGEDPTESYRAAIADYARALDLNPNDAEAHIGRGDAYWALGHWQSSRGEDPTESYRAAIADYTRALEREPHNPNAYRYRGYVRIAAGDYRGAIADWERAIELSPRSGSRLQAHILNIQRRLEAGLLKPLPREVPAESGRLEEGDATFQSGRYSDVFEREWPQGTRVSIVLESAQFHPYLIVVGPDGQRHVDSYFDGKNARVDFVAGSGGMHQIIVTSTTRAGETGAYRLRIWARGGADER